MLHIFTNPFLPLLVFFHNAAALTLKPRAPHSLQPNPVVPQMDHRYTFNSRVYDRLRGIHPQHAPHIYRVDSDNAVFGRPTFSNEGDRASGTTRARAAPLSLDDADDVTDDGIVVHMSQFENQNDGEFQNLPGLENVDPLESAFSPFRHSGQMKRWCVNLHATGMDMLPSFGHC